MVWDHPAVSREDRERLLGGRGCTLWFTGLSGSGKSTIAKALEARLVQDSVHAYRLDGDNLRHGLNADLGFSQADREENVRRAGQVARLLADAGVVAIGCLISPYRADRHRVRAWHTEHHLEFLEVFVDTPVEVCAQRDPKGLYERAKRGEIADFTGVTAPYEAPERPEIHLPTASIDVPESVERCLSTMRERRLLRA